MNKKQEEIPFSQLLAELLDAAQVFNPQHLHHLSRLSPEDAGALAGVWNDIDLTRRRNLVSDLVNFAESDPLLFYDRIGMIALKDEDAGVRVSAIRLLVIEEEPEFAPTLLHLLQSDPHFLVRATAAGALGRYVYLGEVEELPAEVFQQVESALMASFREDAQELVRRRALESVSFSSRKEINPLIEDAFNSGDEDWQESALIAMGASANPKWERNVVDMFDAESAQLRCEAASAAGKLGIKEAKKALMDMAQEDDDEDVRRAAIWALSELGGNDIAELLEEWLDEAESDEEADFLEDALENLLESQMLGDLDLPLFDFDEDSLNDLSEIDTEE